MMHRTLVEETTFGLPKNWTETRQMINSAVFLRKQDALVDHNYSEFEYDQFFAASDTLCDFGDVLFAVENGLWPTSIAECHLRMCGALQAMIVVRNATKQFSRCLGVAKIEKADALYEMVNNYRIITTGHPENHTGSKIVGATYLGRSMFETGVFDIGSYPKEGGWIEDEVNVPELLTATNTATFAYMKACFNSVIDNDLFQTPSWRKFK